MAPRRSFLPGKQTKKHRRREAALKHFMTAEQPQGTVPFPFPHLASLTQVKSKEVLIRLVQYLRRKNYKPLLR